MFEKIFSKPHPPCGSYFHGNLRDPPQGHVKPQLIAGLMKGNQWLVGGFNPSEKHWSKLESSPNRGENKKYVKPPPRWLIVP